jgi:hypothetical protein
MTKVKQKKEKWKENFLGSNAAGYSTNDKILEKYAKYGLDPIPDLDTGIGTETAINHYGLTTLFKLSADGELFIP